jgi:hypothetical protein
LTSSNLLAKFWRTRVAVLNGVPLQGLGAADPPTDGLLGPWGFAVCAGAIATLPSAALGFVLRNADAQAPPFGSWSTEFIEAYNLQWSLLSVPVGIASIVTATYISAWLSLYNRDSNHQRRSMARSAYLYLSSAIGFWCTIVVGFFSVFSDRVLYDWSLDRLLGLPTDAMLLGLLAYVIGGLLLLVWVWKLFATRIPAELFRANGYPRSEGQIPRPLPEIQIGPWTKYRWVALPAVGAASLCVAQIASTILVATTTFQLWLERCFT